MAPGYMVDDRLQIVRPRMVRIFPPDVAGRVAGGRSNKSGWRVVQELQTSIANIGFINIRHRLVDGNLPRRRPLGHQENYRHLSWAGWLGATELADRQSRVFRKREGLMGPELDRCDLLRTIDTCVSIERIVEGAHVIFLRLLRPPRRGVNPEFPGSDASSDRLSAFAVESDR
jgi:hypothetical protein